MLDAVVRAPVLTGTVVRLEPLGVAHVPALVAAAGEDPSLYRWTTVPQGADAARRYVDRALDDLAAGDAVPFAIVRLADEQVVGSTRFLDVARWSWPDGHPEAARRTPDACEIGATWLARSAVRTGANTDAKRLLLAHGFETWRVHRVCLRTDARNARSRAAIERLGARLDGVLRADRAGADGTVRDSAHYSIVAAEWPAVRDHLARLAARHAP